MTKTATETEVAVASAPAQSAPSIFPVTITLPTLAAGEKFIGAIISADGTKRHALILLPEELGPRNWSDAMAWAASIGGELPDRCESALLFATMKDDFRPDWYWTREQHADSADYAWCQYFVNGGQVNGTKSASGRARAVRRLKI